ncbi:MAG: LamG-like jellyroll fold domain-containing protein [Candidatus Methanoperedens sp.]
MQCQSLIKEKNRIAVDINNACLKKVWRICTIGMLVASIAVLYMGAAQALTNSGGDIGPIAQFHFEGNAEDSSGNGNNGTIVGAKFVQGISGQALSFDGVDDYVSVPDSTSLDISGSLTVSFWVKTTTTDNDRGLLSKWGGGSGYILYDVSNKAMFVIDSSATFTITTSNINNGEWHHIVGVYNNSKAIIYFDGVKQGEVAKPVITTNNLPLEIGRYGQNNRYAFNGAIDEVRIYNRALNASEIQALYNSPAPLLTTITVTPSSSSVALGRTLTIHASPKDQSGNPFNASLTWSSSDESVGTIDQSGMVTALKVGEVEVIARSGMVEGRASVNVVEDFTFAHITDIHLGYYYNYFDMKKSVSRFTDTLQDIKGKNPDFIVATGDLVEDRTPEFFMAFKNLVRGFTVYTVPGNHDRRWMVWGNDLTNYKNIINPLNPAQPGELDWSFSHKGYNFIGLDSGADFSVKEFPEPPNPLDLSEYFKNQSEWIQEMTPEADGLKDYQWNKLNSGDFSKNNQRQIIFMHHPVNNDIDDSYFGDQVVPVPHQDPGFNDRTIANYRPQVIQYAINNRVDLVLTGHSHEDKIINVNGGIADINDPRPLFVQTQSAKYGYRIIDIKDGKATPRESQSTRKFDRVSVEAAFDNIFNMHGLHAYSKGMHTGMKADCSDIELGIPDSYYTGDYGKISFVTPEVLVAYYNAEEPIIEEPVEKIGVYPCVRPKVSSISKVQSMNTMQSEESLGNTSFNMSIEDQTQISTFEINFNKIHILASSLATVDMKDTTKNYQMDVDLNGDGTTDKIIYPDSILINPSIPQNNIEISAYNGSGKFFIVSSSGKISSASSLNSLSVLDKPSSEFPFGVIAFNISGLSNGQTVDVTITLPQNLPTNSIYWKFGKTADNQIPHWYQIPFGSNNGDNIITIQLQDGGIGDDDLTANGIIVDNGGPSIDNIAPVTEFNISETPTGSNWFTSDIHVTLSATDDGGSGVNNTEYSIDGTNWIPYIMTPVTISNEGITEVFYRSTDNAGNVESTRNKSIKIDKTQPNISISNVVDGSHYNSNVTPTISIFDTNLITQTVVLNGAPFTSGNVVSAEGNYALVASADDLAGNTLSKIVNFVIDRTPPEAAISFNISSKDIKVYGNETGGEINYTVLPPKKDNHNDKKSDEEEEKGWELRRYTLKDLAGNLFELILNHKKEGNEVKVKVISMQYNGVSIIDAPKNEIQVSYSTEKNSSLKELEQKIEVEKELAAEAKYSFKENKTEIKVKIEGQKEQKLTRAGTVILELITHKGDLNLTLKEG